MKPAQDNLEKEMATHSSILAWRVPWTEEPDRLRSIVLQRVIHDTLEVLPQKAVEGSYLMVLYRTLLLILYHSLYLETIIVIEFL